MSTKDYHENGGRKSKRGRCKHSRICFSGANNQNSCYLANLVQVPVLLDLDYVPELQPTPRAHATSQTTGLEGLFSFLPLYLPLQIYY